MRLTRTKTWPNAHSGRQTCTPPRGNFAGSSVKQKQAMEFVLDEAQTDVWGSSRRAVRLSRPSLMAPNSDSSNAQRGSQTLEALTAGFSTLLRGD